MIVQMAVSIIGIILSVMVALLALSIGGYPKLLSIMSRIYIPPARYYRRAMQAIDHLELLSDAPEDKIKQGIVAGGDIGFEELVHVLKEKRIYNGQVDEIVLGQHDIRSGLATGGTFITPTKKRFLGVINGDSEIMLVEEQWDIQRITSNLADWVLEITRNKVSMWVIIILVLYLVASITSVIITNLPK